MVAILMNLMHLLLFPGGGGGTASGRPELFIKDAADGTTGADRLLLLEDGSYLLLE